MCHKLDYTCLLQSTMRGGLFEATAGRERMEWRNSATSRIYKIKASVHVYSFRQFTKDPSMMPHNKCDMKTCFVIVAESTTNRIPLEPGPYLSMTGQ